MKNLTWQNPEQLFVAQELINKVKSKCCGIKVDLFNNSIGYQLGDLAKQNKWSEERLFKEIIKYKNDGKLQTKLHP